MRNSKKVSVKNFIFTLLLTITFGITIYSFRNAKSIERSAAAGAYPHHLNTTVGNSTNSTSVNANANKYLNSLYIASISTKPYVKVEAVQGLGLTWIKSSNICSGRESTGVDIWYAYGSPVANGAVSAKLASAPKNAILAVSIFSDVDGRNPIGNKIAVNSNGVNGICGNGQDSNHYELTLATNGPATVFSVIGIRLRTNTPAQNITEWKEAHYGSAGDQAGIVVEGLSQEVASSLKVAGTLNSDTDWAAAALEIRAAQANVSPVITATNTSVPSITKSITVTPRLTITRTISPTPTTSQPSTSEIKGIWLSKADIAALPQSGTAWNNIKSAAYSSWGTADISNQDSDHDVYTLAGALVYARTNDATLRTKVANAISSAIGTESGGRTLALGRNLLSYIISADTIDLKNYDPVLDTRFRNWLTTVRKEGMTEGVNLIHTHEDRPNNWGTHAGASRIAADIYIGDTADLARAATVFRGWLGDTSAYSNFTYGLTCYQSSPSHPVGINPVGATLTIAGASRNADGILPDDQRRSGCPAVYPYPKENYVWEALQGAVVQAYLLKRVGYDSFNWVDKALYRATNWLYNTANFPAVGDDLFELPLLDKAYGTNYWNGTSVKFGKNVGWTDWTHSK